MCIEIVAVHEDIFGVKEQLRRCATTRIEPLGDTLKTHGSCPIVACRIRAPDFRSLQTYNELRSAGFDGSGGSKRGQKGLAYLSIELSGCSAGA
jgi:hypothetical protein